MQRYIRPADHCKLLNWLSVCTLLASTGYPLPANAIVGSQIDPNAVASPWAGGGSLSVNGGIYTATAIGSRYIITAAQVVDGTSAQNIDFNLNAGG